MSDRMSSFSTNKLDGCICGEINARHCPIHQEPECTLKSTYVPRRSMSKSVEFFKASDFQRYFEFDAYQGAKIAQMANRILTERGIVVTGLIDDNGHYFGTESVEADTHQALLINIQPLATEDTLESLLREAIDSGDLQGYQRWQSWVERARKLLDK